MPCPPGIITSCPVLGLGAGLLRHIEHAAPSGAREACRGLYSPKAEVHAVDVVAIRTILTHITDKQITRHRLTAHWTFSHLLPSGWQNQPSSSGAGLAQQTETNKYQYVHRPRMAHANPLEYVFSADWLDTFLPDFVLAFALFTALTYAALGRRLGMQRPAIAVSAAIGAALSFGLVWWEQVNGLSIRNLGPAAVGFAIIVLAGVIYQSIRHVGGNWAGAGIALGACILVGWILGIDWHVRPEIMQTIAGATLTVGILAFLIHRKGAFGHFPRGFRELADVRHDMGDLHEDRRLCNSLGDGFRSLKGKASCLFDHPDGADDVMLQLKRMLPAEGWLTERMARLRAKAHLIQRGHVARIEELRDSVQKLPPEAKRRAARELATRYRELKIDARIERLDKAVAENERRIRQLTRGAQGSLQSHDFRKLVDILESASKLQAHNAKLLRIIERTEAKLVAAARQIAKQSHEVTNA